MKPTTNTRKSEPTTSRTNTAYSTTTTTTTNIPNYNQLVAETAYYIAQKKGFPCGSDTQNWLEAEAQVRAKYGKK